MKIKFVADDYGESIATNIAICDSIKLGPVNSVSVLAAKESEYLFIDFLMSNSVQIGAHLYLTQYELLSSDKLRKYKYSKADLIKDICKGYISENFIINEFRLQLKRLVELGLKVKFFDTHQNIHFIPVIYNALCKISHEHLNQLEVRPINLIRFDGGFCYKNIIAKYLSWYLRFEENCFVLINAPGYKSNDGDFSLALREWDLFLIRIRKQKVKKLFVPCHPGMGNFERRLYSNKDFLSLLFKHQVEII